MPAESTFNTAATVGTTTNNATTSSMISNNIPAVATEPIVGSSLPSVKDGDATEQAKDCKY
jgi:hypothetical protein